jgi:RNA polymerase sigma factor (sigma-70 family)
MNIASPAISDAQLLAQYVRDGSQAAFAQIVSRYSNLVYAAAMRQVRDPHVADDVAQAVFIVLSRRASSARADRLAAWLLRATRYCVLDAIKKQTRRLRYEKEAAMLSQKSDEGRDESRREVSDYLDEALSHLRQRESTALALRYLQDKPMEDVAQALGVSVDAAQKIVSRSLSKLRNIFQRRGVILSGAVLAAALTQESAKAAPAALMTSSAGASASASGSHISLAKGAIHMMLWTQIKTAAAIAAVALVAAALGGGALAINRALADGSPAPIPAASQTQALAPMQAAPAEEAVPSAYDSPFLELVNCRVRIPIDLKPAANQQPTASVTFPAEEYPEAHWQPDPSWAAKLARYSLSIASPDAPGAAKTLRLPATAVSQPLVAYLNSPGEYAITLVATDAAGNTLASVSEDVTVNPVEFTQIAIGDIPPDGDMRFWSVLQNVNGSAHPITQFTFLDDDEVHLQKIFDDQNRPIQFTSTRSGRQVTYNCTLNQPIQPGDAGRELAVGTIPGMVRSLPDGSFAYEFKHYPGANVPVRRLDLIRLPPNATLVSLDPPTLAHKLYNGQIQVFSDTTIPPGGSELIVINYQLPTNP